MKAYALEITAHDGNALVHLYFSSSPALVTGASDTPPNTTFQARLVQPGNYSIQAFSGGGTYGRSQVGYGEIVLSNEDGVLDGLLNYGFDGRKAVLRCREDDGTTLAYPGDWDTVFTGTIDTPEAVWPGYNDGTIVLRMRDRMAELHVKLPLAVYAGTNVLPDGLEGTPNDLQGKTKPLLLGKCYNMPLQCVNTSKLIYAVSPPTGGLYDYESDWDAIADFDAVLNFFGVIVSGPVSTPLGTEYRRGGCSSTGIEVYDSGLALTKGTDYTDEADMLANAPASGYYRVLPAYGYVRLGSSPAGEITCTAQDNNGSEPHTVGRIIRSILRDYMRWDTSRFNITELAAMDTACALEVGSLITQETYIDELIDTFCAAIGACYYFDQYGVFRIFQVADPATAISEKTLTASGSIRYMSVSNTNIPNNQIRLRQQRNWQVQTSGLAGAVTVDRRAWLANEWRENVAYSSQTAIKHLLSEELAFDTPFAADAQCEATRRLNLYSVRRDLIDLELVQDAHEVSEFRIGQIIGFQLQGRYGYTTKKMLLTGIQADLVQRKITLTVWG